MYIRNVAILVASSLKVWKEYALEDITTLSVACIMVLGTLKITLKLHVKTMPNCNCFSMHILAVLVLNENTFSMHHNKII